MSKTERMIFRIVLFRPTAEQLRDWRKARKLNYEAWLDNLNMTNLGLQRSMNDPKTKAILANTGMRVKAYMTKDAIGLMELWAQKKDFKKVKQEELDMLSEKIQSNWNRDHKAAAERNGNDASTGKN